MNKIKRRTYPPIRPTSPSVLGQFLDDTAGFSQNTMAKWIVELVLTPMSVLKDFAHIKLTSQPQPPELLEKEFKRNSFLPVVLPRCCYANVGFRGSDGSNRCRGARGFLI